MTTDGHATVNADGEAAPAPTPSAEAGDQPSSMGDFIQAQYDAQYGTEGVAPSDDLDSVPADLADTDTGTPAPGAQEEPDPAQAGDEGTDDAAGEPGPEDGLPPDHPDAAVEAAAETAEPPSEEVEDEAAELPDDVSDEELAAYRPRAAKRVKQLLEQRYELRQEIERSRPVMERIEQHQLGGEDVQMALDLTGALQRGDFQGFLNGVAPLVQAAQQYLGHTLSPELQAQVDGGFITRELAQQMQSAQSRAAWDKQQLERGQEAQAAEQANQVRQVMARSVMTWEGEIRASDPDYAQKEPTIRRFAQALVAERGAPKTSEEAVQLAKDAYAEANKVLVAMRPPPAPSTVKQPSAGDSHRAPPAAPTSLAGAVQAGLRRAQSA